MHKSLFPMADEKTPEPDKSSAIGVFYQRSRHYRTIQPDGAQMGITPRGRLQFTLFTDQKPMPEYVLHEITPEGNLGGPREEVVKEGFIREVEVNVIMDFAAAVSFLNVLQSTLKQVKEIQDQQRQAVAEQQHAQTPKTNEG